MKFVKKKNGRRRFVGLIGNTFNGISLSALYRFDKTRREDVGQARSLRHPHFPHLSLHFWLHIML